MSHRARSAAPPRMERQRDPVDELVFECLERLPSEGGGAIDAVCAQRPDLAAALRQRISALRDAGLFPADGDERPFPEKLGDFRLLRRLGAGGMGVVYQAEQLSLGREVALKLIRPEQLYFPQSRERFRREILAVASLHHAGIVPVHAGGEEDGIPYFAMEMIRGCTLADVLEELAGRAPEALSSAVLRQAIAARSAPGTPLPDELPLPKGWVETCLQLARQVADALDHAHMRGLVHRDIKPSNIALTPDGRAMLLDFGLTSSGRSERLTITGSAVGTLLYMSPEQVRGTGPLDARTDVYSLGVTLYELLTLQPPYRADDDAQTRKAIEDGRPDSIRARNRRVSPDAETVCLKAMDVDPARRYASAAAFARDLGNVLGYRPIEARRPGLLLRARRFAQRRPATAVAIALGLAILLGLPTALWVQERRALLRIREEAETSRQVTEFLVALFESAGPGQTLGEDVRLRPVLEQGVKRLEDQLQDQPDIRARLLFTLARVHRHLGAYEKAAELAARADAALAPAARADSDLRRDIRWLGANVQTIRGDSGGAERVYRELLAELRARYGEAHPLVADCLGDLGEALYRKGRVEEAEAALGDALAMMRASSTGEPWRLADRVEAMARLLVSTGRPTEARGMLEEALAVREDLFPSGAPSVVTTLCSLGRCLTELRAWDEAETTIRTALAQAERIYAGDHPAIADVEVTLAYFLSAAGRWNEAETPLRRALAICESAYGEEHPRVAWCLNDLGLRLQRCGRSAEAEPLLQRARGIWSRAHPHGHRDLAIALLNLAEVQADLECIGEAERLAREALAMLGETTGESSVHAASGHVVLAGILVLRNALDGAEEEARAAIELLAAQPDRPIELGLARTRLALVLNRRGDAPGAEREAEAALAGLGAVLPAEHPHLAWASYHVGWALLNQGKTDAARPRLLEAAAALRRAHPDGHAGLGFVLDQIGVLELRRGRPRAALPWLRESLDLRRRFLQPASYWVQVSLHNLAVALLQLDDAEALPLFEELLELRRPRASTGPDPELAATLHFAAAAQLASGDARTAERYATEALELRRALYPDASLLSADTRSLLGAVKTRLRDFATAERLLAEAYAVLVPAHATSSVTARCRQRLAQLYEAWEKPELAAKYR